MMGLARGTTKINAKHLPSFVTIQTDICVTTGEKNRVFMGTFSQYKALKTNLAVSILEWQLQWEMAAAQ